MLLFIPGREGDPLEVKLNGKEQLDGHFAPDYFGEILRICKELKDDKSVLTLELAMKDRLKEEEFHSALNGRVLVWCVVHGGEPKRYQMQPNPAASSALNLWNLHGPILCGGCDDIGNTVGLSLEDFKRFLQEEVKAGFCISCVCEVSFLI
jgi:hypothetical protein